MPNQDHSRRRRDDDNRCEGNSTEAPRLGSRMNIGIFGLWGMNVPGVQFGGFETAFTEIGARLVARGHSVTIYSRRPNYPPSNRPSVCRGVRVVYVPCVDTKNLSFLTATSTALLHALVGARHDVYLFANVGSGIHCLLARLLGKRVVVNVDGLDWARPKWNDAGQVYFQLAARAALFGCDALIADADAMVDYYLTRFGRRLEMISYGAEIASSTNPGRVAEHGLKPGSYYLVVARLVPDNNVHLTIEGFKRVASYRRLAVVGGSTYDSEYVRELHRLADSRVVLLGHVHDQNLLRELYCNSYAYVHGHSFGGTNPALLRALGYGCAVLAADTVFSAEVLDKGRYGMLWHPTVEGVEAVLARAEREPDLMSELAARAPDRIRERYCWDRVTEQYEALLLEVLDGRSDSRRRIALALTGIVAALLLVGLALPWRLRLCSEEL